MRGMNALPYDADQLRDRAQSIISNVRELSQLGWTPATSSNFSERLDERHAAITVSGRDKGRLAAEDIMVVDFGGQPVATSHRPSAETLLHTQLYARYPEIGCVLHTHSLVQTVASRLFAGAGHVRLEGFELLKAFHGNSTHDDSMDVSKNWTGAYGYALVKYQNTVYLINTVLVVAAAVTPSIQRTPILHPSFVSYLSISRADNSMYHGC